MTNTNNQKCAGLDCNRDLTTIKSNSITCDHCENWFCMECSNIPKKLTLEKKFESAKELQTQCSGQKDSFANIVQKWQMPNLDSINANVKKSVR